jgi:hypothetical protein
MNKITECYEIASNTLIKPTKEDRMAKRGLLNDNLSIKLGSSSSNTSPENTFDNKVSRHVALKTAQSPIEPPMATTASIPTPPAVSFKNKSFFRNFLDFLSKSNENEKKFRNIPLNRIMSFKGKTLQASVPDLFGYV